MGLFEDRSTEAYDRARTAVEQGVATQDQKDMVGKEARQAGSRGNAARDTLQGK